MKYVGKVLLNNFMSFKGLKKKKIIKFITSKVSFMDYHTSIFIINQKLIFCSGDIYDFEVLMNSLTSKHLISS